MRNFSQFGRRCIAVSILVLALACSTFAGDMQYPGVTSPPPATTSGDMQYPTVTAPTETADGDVQYPGVTTLLTLWQSTLALF